MLDQPPSIDFLVAEMKSVIDNQSPKTSEFRKEIPKQNKRIMLAVAALTSRVTAYHRVKNVDNGKISGLTEQTLSVFKNGTPKSFFNFLRMMWAFPEPVRRELVELFFFDPSKK
jgi:hypothetical protein